MERFATRPVIVALAVFAAWMGFGAVRITIAADRNDPDVSWTGIAALYVIAVAAALLAFFLYRIRRAKGHPPLTNG